ADQPPQAGRALPADHHGVRPHLPRHQDRRVQGEVRSPPGARSALPLRLPARRALPPGAGRGLLLALFLHDRAARPAHGRRGRPAQLPAAALLAGTLHLRVAQPARMHRPVLALRGHRLDLPVPAAVPDRGALVHQQRGDEMSSTMAEPAPAGHTPTRKPYFLTCAFLLVMTLITYVVAKFDLGPLN